MWTIKIVITTNSLKTHDFFSNLTGGHHEAAVHATWFWSVLSQEWMNSFMFVIKSFAPEEISQKSNEAVSHEADTAAYNFWKFQPDTEIPVIHVLSIRVPVWQRVTAEPLSLNCVLNWPLWSSAFWHPLLCLHIPRCLTHRRGENPGQSCSTSKQLC